MKFLIKRIVLKSRKIALKLRKIACKHSFGTISYSQYGQDIYCLKKYFSNISSGVFLEVGADDGLHLSNSYLYELKGWNGMCIEPSPERFNLLEQNRNCIVENFAIAEQKGTVDFMEITGYGKALSGIVNEYDQQHKIRIQKELGDGLSKNSKIIKVKTIPLSDLLQKHGLTHVNFCTIDVEGAELSVLRSIDLYKVTFDVILVENNYNDDSVESFMLENGFQKEERIASDDVYVRKGFKS